MTSHAPIPGRPTRPCTAELLAGSPLPDTITAALMITDPKIPAAVGN
jgi:hypothetical protein